MARYKKKPVVIDAWQFRGHYDFDMAEMIEEESGGVVKSFYTFDESGDPYIDHLYVKTLEGIMKAPPGYFIIRGVQGEWYPCKPDIFKETYDKVNV